MARLYGGDPNLYLDTTDVINKIKKESNNGYFEKLIKKYILDNNNGSIIVLKPKKGLQNQKDEAIKEKLQKYKKSLSKKDIQKIVDDTTALTKWENAPDSKQALATIPALSFKDLDIHFTDTPTKTEAMDGAKVWYHPISSNGLAFSNFYFDFSKVPQDKYKYVTLLASLVGNVDTKKNDYLSLSDKNNLIVSFTGDDKAYGIFKNSLKEVVGGLNTTVYPEPKYSLTQPEKNQGIITSEKNSICV